ncbi:hypothetical protein BU15DRAFT_55198, partial [Melanogaster broomeanus]
VLELVKKLFVWMTPNTTAWCKALESFFDGQGYKLKTKVSESEEGPQYAAELSTG